MFLPQLSSIVTIQFVIKSFDKYYTQHRATLMVKTPLKQLPLNREVELKNLLLLLVVQYFLKFKTLQLKFLPLKSWRFHQGSLSCSCSGPETVVGYIVSDRTKTTRTEKVFSEPPTPRQDGTLLQCSLLRSCWLV